MSVRRPPHITRRQFLGLPHDFFGVLSRRAPQPLADAGARLIRRLSVGDLSAYGLAPPADGAVTRLEAEGRVPTVDDGRFTDALREGRIRVVGDIHSLRERSVVLRDATQLEPDLLVAATGYRSGVDELVGHLGVLDEYGEPAIGTALQHPAAPGVYFVGFRDPRSGLLREMRLEAGQVASRIGTIRSYRYPC
jgi:hypothetical protein